MNVLDQIHAAPRDTTIVVQSHADLAHALRDRGFHVLLVGGTSDRVQCVANARELEDQWSRLSCRNPSAIAIASPEVCETVERATNRAAINNNTSVFRARGWVEHFVRNLPTLTNPCGIALEGLRGVPAFVVGAGACLDRNHHLLEEASRKGIVIAVNAAARLQAVDVALTVESNDLRHKLGPLTHVGLRAFGVTAPPAVMAHGEGVLAPIFAGELGGLVERITGVPKLACSAHGGTAAFSLAERWGCDPIVLVGMDFALADGGRIYPECLGIGDSRAKIVDGAWAFDWDPTLKAQPRANPLHDHDAAVEVASIDGGKVWSTGAFSGTRAWFESAAVGMRGHHRLISAAEWGAAVAGFEAKTLRAVLDELPDREFSAQNGGSVPEERLKDWIGAHMRGLYGVWEAAAMADVDAATAAMLIALRAAPLLEPWCHAHVAAVMAERRSAAPRRNARAEWAIAGHHARRVIGILADEAHSLAAELEVARDAVG